MPLSGIKVLDLGRFLSGPFCGALLADMGAEVIKIEVPGRGDEIRYHGVLVNGESAYFVGMNRSKKSLTLDLKSAEGKEIFARLVREADVVLENFRPDVMRRLGLNFEALREINPRIIYCGISGFGKDGPYALRPSFDFIAQGMSGLMSVTGFPDREPVRVGTPISDSIAALYAAYGISLALLVRQRTGDGQEVQVSLVDGVISLLSFQADKYFGRGEVPNAREMIIPCQLHTARSKLWMATSMWRPPVTRCGSGSPTRSDDRTCFTMLVSRPTTCATSIAPRSIRLSMTSRRGGPWPSGSSASTPPACRAAPFTTLPRSSLIRKYSTKRWSSNSSSRRGRFGRLDSPSS